MFLQLHKCNGRPFREKKKKKKDKILNITIAEITKNIYHIARQNLHSVHVPNNKNKIKSGRKGVD